jgi:hypothetical protein
MKKNIGKRVKAKLTATVAAAVIVLSVSACSGAKKEVTDIQPAGTSATQAETEEAAAADTSSKEDPAEVDTGKTGENTETPETETSTLYKLKAIEGGESAATEEEVKMLESFGVLFYMEFKNDGTVLADAFGQKYSGTWNESSVALDNSTPLSYTKNGDEIIFKEGEISMIFQKTTQDEIDDIMKNVPEADGSVYQNTDEAQAAEEMPAETQAEPVN